MEGRVHRALADADLTPSQFGVLEALHRQGPLSQGRLAQQIGKSSGNLTTVLDNLARRELVARCRHENDRRVVQVALTGAGRQALRSALPRHAHSVAEALARLEPAERARLAELCRKLMSAEPRSDDPRAGGRGDDAAARLDESLATKGAPT